MNCGHGVRAAPPAVLPAGVRSSHDIRLSVDLDAGVAIESIASSSLRLVRRADPALEHQIIELSIAHHVLTQLTAFVAGELLWQRRYPSPGGSADRRSVGSVALAGSEIVIATRDGKLFGLDAPGR